MTKQNNGGCGCDKTTTGGASKRPLNKWMKALKEFNKDKKTWTIPKKGSEDYKKVKKMSENM